MCGKNTYEIYGIPVRDYWHEAETEMVKGMQTVLTGAGDLDPETAARYITEYCNQVQTQAFNDAGELLNDVRWYMSHNSNTMKNGRNPETHEIIDELRKVDPMKLDLDASAYGMIPEVPEPAQAASSGNHMAAVAALAFLGAAAAVIFTRRKKV